MGVFVVVETDMLLLQSKIRKEKESEFVVVLVVVVVVVVVVRLNGAGIFGRQGLERAQSRLEGLFLLFW